MDVVEALEGETCLVRCVKQSSACDRISICPARDIWKLLGEKINETLKNVSLAQLAGIKKKTGK
jgi:DNA-binding IscR family transcriptional regulator